MFSFSTGSICLYLLDLYRGGVFRPSDDPTCVPQYASNWSQGDWLRSERRLVTVVPTEALGLRVFNVRIYITMSCFRKGWVKLSIVIIICIVNTSIFSILLSVKPQDSPGHLENLFSIHHDQPWSSLKSKEETIRAALVSLLFWHVQCLEQVGRLINTATSPFLPCF